MFDNSEAPEEWKLRAEDFDVFSTYLSYVKNTEAPTVIHRWSLISSIATLLGRSCHLVHGHSRIFPNLYITIVGEPAVRKSSAIKGVKRLLLRAGYETFAADKTSKEQFLVDLEGFIDPEVPENRWKIKEKAPQYDSVTADNLWGGDLNGSEPREVFIAADEFSEFTGHGNFEFYITLGNLWDWDDEEKPFVQRLKTTRSVSIYQPTINILSGTTADNFSKIFPPEALGSGFLSRLLLIYAERSGRKIAFPPPPDTLLEHKLVSYFIAIRSSARGQLHFDPEAEALLTLIYEKDHNEIDDPRFKTYSGRSFTQLLKLCMIIAVARFRATISVSCVIEANTFLTSAEYLMPKAMGEFGKNKNADVTSKILQFLEEAAAPKSAMEIQAYVRRDAKPADVAECLQSLLLGKKIQIVKLLGKSGYLPLKEVRKKAKHVDWSLLTQEEREHAGVIE